MRDPDGVVSPDMMSDTVIAEIRNAQRIRRLGSRGTASPSTRSPKWAPHDHDFAALMDAVRQDDLEAVQQLWHQYHARIF